MQVHHCVQCSPSWAAACTSTGQRQPWQLEWCQRQHRCWRPQCIRSCLPAQQGREAAVFRAGSFSAIGPQQGAVLNGSVQVWSTCQRLYKGLHPEPESKFRMYSLCISTHLTHSSIHTCIYTPHTCYVYDKGTGCSRMLVDVSCRRCADRALRAKHVSL